MSVLRSRKFKPKLECVRFNNLQMRRAGRVRSDEGSGEDSEEDETSHSEVSNSPKSAN